MWFMMKNVPSSNEQKSGPKSLEHENNDKVKIEQCSHHEHAHCAHSDSDANHSNHTHSNFTHSSHTHATHSHTEHQAHGLLAGGAHAHHLSGEYNRAFALGIGLNALFILLELFYGIYASSLALMADAGHNFVDILGLLMAWAAYKLGTLKPSGRFTFGYRRVTLLAALLNGLFLFLAVGVLLVKAVDRIDQPVQVMGGTVMVVAALGIFVNGFTAWLFLKGGKFDLNMRGAFLHMAADSLVSLGVVLSGFMIIATGWSWIDSAVSFLVCGIIILTSWGLLRDSVFMMLDSVPRQLDLEKVRRYLLAQEGIKSAHDLHIWALGTSDIALSAHIVMPDGHPGDAFLHKLSLGLSEEFRITHATFQVELGQGECSQKDAVSCSLAG